MSRRTDLNEYLFYEFGLDLNETASREIGDHWPFQLTFLKSLAVGDCEVHVFSFTSEGEEYYGFSGPYMMFYLAEGMDFDLLHLHLVGSQWISNQEPVDLNTSRVGDERMPATLKRRKAIQELSERMLGSAEFKILEGLFFPSSASYLALVQAVGEKKTYIIGTNIEAHKVLHPNLSAHRQLSIGVGELLREHKLRNL